jgi:pyrroline-5-carboxylate reductase
MSSTLELPQPTWLVGCGNMGGAILEGWRSGGIDLSPISVIRPSGKPIEGVRVVESPSEIGSARPQMALLAFKPQNLHEIASRFRPYFGPETMVVSILAGVEISTLRSHFPDARGIIRAMPNLPVAVRRGVTGLYGDADEGPLKQQIGDLFAALGFAMWMADEGKLSALGSVAGAGTAYVARFISALAKAAVRRGLTQEIASTLALETVLGTAWMAAASKESMDSIARRVASPNGTTEAGLAVLDEDDALDELVALAIDASSSRGAELAKEARAARVGEHQSLT